MAKGVVAQYNSILVVLFTAGMLFLCWMNPLDAFASPAILDDGTIFDADWYEEELEINGITDVGETTQELYRQYQLYGQGDGLTAYDASSLNSIVLEEMKEVSSIVRSWKEKEYGPGWLLITADLYDAEEVLVWNTQETIPDDLMEELEDAIDLFEEEEYDVGFVVVDLTTGKGLSYRAGIEVYSASVIKAPYIFSLLESGIEPTDDMYLAGNQSDNDAYKRIRTTYGNDVFAAWIEGTGIPSVQSKTRYITTTPLDLCRMFYKGTNLLLGDEEYSDWARTTFTDSLNSAAALTIGEEKTVYSKAGWISTSDTYSSPSYTNAAVVDDGEYPYVLSFMSNSPGYVGLELAQELIPVLDGIHDEILVPETSLLDESAQDLSSFASDAQHAVE